MSIDSMGDFLTIIRNALMVSKRQVVAPFSKMRYGVSKILLEEGFIKEVKKTVDASGRPSLELLFKYVNGESAIHEIKRISKPGRRYYEGVKNLTPVIGGLGVSIISSNAGIITHKQAKKLSVGGEIICHIW